MVGFRKHSRDAQDGCNIRLTVDTAIQRFVETALDETMAQWKPESATCIVMRPKTGEILAMANKPDFDPNQSSKATIDETRNRAITNIVEPGSTFKIVTVASALNEKLVDLSTQIFCENGAWKYNGTVLHDHKQFGTLTVEEGLAESSNILAGKLGVRLGEKRFYEYIRKFGFGERTGVMLPGEIRGLLEPVYKWSKISISHIPMGHEVGVTPLQMACAMSTLANNGKMMLPQIVKQVEDEEGNVVQKFEPTEVRQVVSEETARTIRRAMMEVVSAKGTAPKAAVEGQTVGGKTGTAEKFNPKGGYFKDKYVVSFIGFLPAENPEFVVLVMVDDAKAPEKENYGGTICAPVFSQIAGFIARQLDLPPTLLVDQTKPKMIVATEGKKKTR
jgi:cell division protein FtsI (penicillin-binding protein 3)/stage V sporulation protein D (sporulation-specific penicillin-binding protein)